MVPLSAIKLTRVGIFFVTFLRDLFIIILSWVCVSVSWGSHSRYFFRSSKTFTCNEISIVNLTVCFVIPFIITLFVVVVLLLYVYRGVECLKYCINLFMVAINMESCGNSYVHCNLSDIGSFFEYRLCFVSKEMWFMWKIFRRIWTFQ